MAKIITEAPGNEIIKAIHAIMSEVGYVQKTGENTFHGYKYANEADVLAALRPAMLKHGLVLIPSANYVSLIDEWGNTTVQIAYILAHISGEVWPEKIMAYGCGGDRNKTGVGDKGLYKAITGANKYLLFKLFQIETGTDPENDSEQQEALAKQADEDKAFYMKAAIDIAIPTGHDTVDELTSWWKTEGKNRKKLGIVEGTLEYDKLVEALRKRKGDIMSKDKENGK